MAYNGPPPPAYHMHSYSHQPMMGAGSGYFSADGGDSSVYGNINNSDPLVALGGQLALLVHASFACETTEANAKTTAINFLKEAEAYEKLREVVVKCAGGTEAAATTGLEVRSVFPWKINHEVKQRDGQKEEKTNSEGRSAEVNALGLKTTRSSAASSAPPGFPIAERDGYATIALVVGAASDPSGDLIPRIGETLKGIRVQQLLTKALASSVLSSPQQEGVLSVAGGSGASEEKEKRKAMRVMVDNVGFIDISLADELLTRSFAPISVQVGSSISSGKAAGKGGHRAEEESVGGSSEGVAEKDALALEDKMCAVLIEGFLDAIPIGGSSDNSNTNTDESNISGGGGDEKEHQQQQQQQRLVNHLVPLTMRETVPMLEGYMRQCYGARLVALHPAAAREAFLECSSAAPLGSAAVTSSERLSSLLSNPTSSLSLDPSDNPFTIYCFFDFSASTILPVPTAASPAPTSVRGLGKMFLAFLPSHPQAEAFGAHLRGTLQAQKVFNGNPIRANSISGKQFVRALRGIQEIGDQ